jgi:hypothetical protein
LLAEGIILIVRIGHGQPLIQPFSLCPYLIWMPSLMCMRWHLHGDRLCLPIYSESEFQLHSQQDTGDLICFDPIRLYLIILDPMRRFDFNRQRWRIGTFLFIS